MNSFQPTRRQFMKSGALLGGGLVFGFSLTGCGGGNAAYPFEQAAGALVPNALLQITPAGEVRFYCPRDEMGQGVTTGLTTIIAEELGVAPSAIDVRLASVHPDYGNPAFGNVQLTGGSTAVSAHYLPLREAGAKVRSVLLDAAAKDLGLPRSALSLEDGQILAGGDRHPLGRFVATAASLPFPETADLKNPSDFRYIGKEMPRLDSLAKATGVAQFGIDVDLPDLHYAAIKHGPVLATGVASYDASRAEAMPGVVQVVELPSGVAVVAQKYWQAKQAADALEVEWTLDDAGRVNSAQLRQDYARALEAEEGIAEAEAGDLESGFAAAQQQVESDYWAPFLSHAPLEPMNAVVRIEGEAADVWSGTQAPGAAQGTVARTAGLDPQKVRSHQTYLGGGFGRRATLTHIEEATRLAMATGKPVKLIWSREDDMRNGFYRPASLMRIRAGLDAEGRITAWEAKRVGGNITPETLENALPAIFPGMPQFLANLAVGASGSLMRNWTVDPTSIEGLFEDYDLPNRVVRHVTLEHGMPLTFWRSVGHSYTAFAKEVAMDELAQKAGMHPGDFRALNAQGNPRLKAVIERATAAMKAMRPPAGHHLGMAAHGSFGSYVAEVAEVSVERGRIKVHKVLCVVDCGLAVNPDVVRAQMEGGIMYGLTAALHGKVELREGDVIEGNFDTYPLVRMNEAPAVEVAIVASQEHPTGVGEPGLPPIAPAVANAVHAATGQRLRALPLTPA